MTEKYAGVTKNIDFIARSVLTTGDHHYSLPQQRFRRGQSLRFGYVRPAFYKDHGHKIHGHFSGSMCDHLQNGPQREAAIGGNHHLLQTHPPTLTSSRNTVVLEHKYPKCKDEQQDEAASMAQRTYTVPPNKCYEYYSLYHV
jgi:hypothetical protein